MKVAIHLRRTLPPAPATALLVLSPEPAVVLDLCAKFGAGSWPRVFRVADGFLVKLPQPTKERLPGTIALRAGCDHLLFPVDADIVPQLHDDEARAIVSAQGLILLPGGRALAFSAEKPVPLAELLTGLPLEPSSWEPLPAPPAQADRIRDIRWKESRTPEDILSLEEALSGASVDADESGGDGDFSLEEETAEGIEESRQSLRQRARNVLRRWAQRARRLFREDRRTHKKIRKKRLPVRGRLANWAKAFARLPAHITQSLLDRQRAALLRLLREFREGDPDKALRRALPAADPKAQKHVPATNAILPFHNLLYSLRNLFGSRVGASWLGGADVWPDLFQEYRRAAEKAIQAGDYRRAAFIYGKLLRDYRMAASVLVQGGLYHDAGVLYLEMVNDPIAAARAFESAGELDRAVALYREAGQLALAGDALKRAGLEEAALDEYCQAAEELVAQSRDFLAAGELLATRAQRHDFALAYFREGWSLRPAPNDTACALRLARHFAGERSLAYLTTLVDEADLHFAAPVRDAEAGLFYNELARLADRRGLETVRDDLRDRALLGLAGKLRQRADNEVNRGRLVSDLLGHSAAWKPAVVSDAAFAVHAALPASASKRQQFREHRAPFTTVQLRMSSVTAGCASWQTEHLFIGSSDGQIACVRPGSSEVAYLPVYGMTVHALAAHAEGKHIVALCRAGDGQGWLTSYARDRPETFAIVEHRPIDGPGPFVLAPLQGNGAEQGLVLCDGQQLKILKGLRLLPEPGPTPAEECPAGMLALPPFTGPQPTPRLLLFYPWRLRYVCMGQVREMIVNWRPGIPRGNTLLSPQFSWALPDLQHLEVVLVGSDGVFYWTALSLMPEQVEIETTSFFATDGGYRAAALLHAGFAAAVAGEHIDWFRCRSTGLQHIARTPFTLPAPAACFTSLSTGELFIVCADGLLARVRLPQ